MRKITFLTLTISFLLILTACPYASKVPIDQPNMKIDKKLIGKWVKLDDLNKKKPNYFQISVATNKQYNVVKYEYQSSDSAYKEVKYVSHMSKIGDNKFFNMQKDGTGDYYLYKIVLKGDKFTLFEVTDNIDEKFENSEELKNFIKKYMHLSFFYNKDEKTYAKEK